MNTAVHFKCHSGPGTFTSAYLQICDAGISHIQIPILDNLNSKYYKDNAKFIQRLQNLSLWHIYQYFLLIM